MSINNFMEKIKLFLESEKGKDILVIMIVVLVGLASFELGRLSKQDSSNGLKIEYQGQEANAMGSISSNMPKLAQNTAFQGNTDNSNKGSYFASKLGKKFYSITCSAGKTIKQENRIYFSSTIEATNAGYELSSACR